MRERATLCLLILLGVVALSGCQNAAPVQAGPNLGTAAKPAAVQPARPAEETLPTAHPEPRKQETAPVEATPPVEQAAPTQEVAKPTESVSAALPAPQASPTAPAVRLPAEKWKEWPVIPIVPEAMREVYQRGLQEGRKAEAFSILGDCQSQPDVFMGLFDSDPDFVSTLPEHLQVTIRQYRGSFDRYSPTVKDGTTEGALLWADWNDNKEKKCERGETPLECELRVHQPSIVFIHVGTHWEARQERYMRKIIERVLEFGAVPVMVTKADNRELDERVNANLVKLAVEYELPVWNFWASVQDLPNRGMLKDSNMYLNKQGLDVHRLGGIEALDAVWRGLR